MNTPEGVSHPRLLSGIRNKPAQQVIDLFEDAIALAGVMLDCQLIQLGVGHFPPPNPVLIISSTMVGPKVVISPVSSANRRRSVWYCWIRRSMFLTAVRTPRRNTGSLFSAGIVPSRMRRRLAN